MILPANFGFLGAPKAETDPYWSNVVLLTSFDGANGSTTFTDKSLNTKTISVYRGIPVISTAQSKFGGSSLYLRLNDGTWRYSSLLVAGSSDFVLGTGDFTIETWVRLSSLSQPTFLSTQKQNAPTNSYLWYFGGQDFGGMKLKFATGSPNTFIFSTNTLSINTWYHVAVTRESGTTRMFLNGNLETTSSAFSGYNLQLGDTLKIGTYWDGTDATMDGYLDEIRITKGVARYTASFVVPTKAFPSS